MLSDAASVASPLSKGRGGCDSHREREWVGAKVATWIPTPRKKVRFLPVPPVLSRPERSMVFWIHTRPNNGIVVQWESKRLAVSV